MFLKKGYIFFIIYAICLLLSSCGSGSNDNANAASMSKSSKILSAIVITPANPCIVNGDLQQFTATGIYSDNTTANITLTVSWTSSNTSVSTINGVGQGTAVSLGSSTIKAIYEGISGSTTLTVTRGCIGASPTWTAEPDYTSVSACVSKALAGDTINVKAGSGSETWPANAVVIPANKPVKLIGPGRDNLIIKLSDYNPAIVVGPYAGSIATPGTEISGFTFHSYIMNQRSCAIKVAGSGWRIHHNKYQNDINSYAYSGLFVTASDVPEASGIKISGLVDNNVLVNGRVTSGGYAFAVESAIWNEDIGLGTENAVYVEDNIFSTTEGLAAGQITSDLTRGGKIVFRYNTVVNGGNLAHGIQSATTRGSRSWEFYGNSYSTTIPSQRVIELKSGTGVIFNNYFNGYYYNSIVSFWHQRSETSSGGTAGICDGTSQWDGNATGLSGWLCRDQIGAGKDNSSWSEVTTLPAPAQAAAPAYLWGVYKTYNGTTSLVPVVIPYTSSAVHIKTNRDYHEQTSTSTFNGTSGVGCGTLDNLPSTCTPGVAYWATSQSCSNLTGMVGTNPATPISGTLYKCNASSQWVASYTPYTYPHPLRK